MRSGNRRGVTLALGLACGLALAALTPGAARAQIHTIPRLVPAADLNTGGPYYAPPIPYGHYAGKNLIGRCCGRVNGLVGSCAGLLHAGAGLCHLCGGKGCFLCGGSGLGHGGKGGLGNGHGGHGHGGGAGFGNGTVIATGAGAGGAIAGGTVIAGGNGHGNGYGAGCGHDHGRGHNHGRGACNAGGHATTDVNPTSQAAPTAQAQAMPQGPVVDPGRGPAMCGDPGCPIRGVHKHLGCSFCGGKGCRKCGPGDPCKFCGGKGCKLCGGLGNLCKLCGGLGCSACAKAKGLLAGLFHHNKIDWFVGPGGPVPLTPGYTPYVNVTRSPRDFLAFPPFVP